MESPQQTSNKIQFLLNGELISVTDSAPTQSLLYFLREKKKLVGTKEACAEGDCGACTVVIAELVGGELQLHTANACIQFLPTLNGKSVFTVESLRQEDGNLHPVQQSMVDNHGSQCGFCTPGFIMSLWNIYNEYQAKDIRPTRLAIKSALAGNLCRCTGYRPIIDAAEKMFDLPKVKLNKTELRQNLAKLQSKTALSYEFNGNRFFSPKTLEQLIALKSEYADATILAGGTDVGLWVNKQLRKLGPIIYVGEVAELKQITTCDGFIRIGAGASISDVYDAISNYYPQMDEMWERFASPPIRNSATLGGNVANGSPIGDSMPVLISLGAEVVLRGSERARTLLLEDFYLGYMKNALKADEIVECIKLPLPSPGKITRCYKLSKRYDSDISAVFAAFSIVLLDERVESCVIAYGGMAATPKRASLCEQSLIGERWDEKPVQNAMKIMAQDYSPMTDGRASDINRAKSAANLLYRFYLETRTSNPVKTEDLSVFASNLSVGDIPARVQS